MFSKQLTEPTILFVKDNNFHAKAVRIIWTPGNQLWSLLTGFKSDQYDTDWKKIICSTDKNIGQCYTWLDTLRCSHPDASADQISRL